MTYKAIVIGVSAGGLNAIKKIVPALPENFRIPIIIVQHISAHSDGYWITIINNLSKLHVKEADEKEKIESGYIYIAPPNYHTLIEPDHTFTFTIDPRVNYARPAIDVLFESAAHAYKKELIGIVLTGASDDGARGLKKIKEFGGLAIVQDPNTAESKLMPTAAISATQVDHILPLDKIAEFIMHIDQKTAVNHEFNN